MKLASALSALVCASAVAGCSGKVDTHTTCTPATCSGSSAGYTLCTAASGSVSYMFGGQTCSCVEGQAACGNCSNEVASYCLGMVATQCSATLTGGIDGSVASCSVLLSFDSGSSSWTASSEGGVIASAASQQWDWKGFTMTIEGAPAAGQYDQADSDGNAGLILDDAGGDPDQFTVAFGQGATIGDFALTVSDLGPATMSGGASIYASAHGSITSRYVDSNTTAPLADVAMSVTF